MCVDRHHWFGGMAVLSMDLCSGALGPATFSLHPHQPWRPTKPSKQLLIPKPSGPPSQKMLVALRGCHEMQTGSQM